MHLLKRYKLHLLSLAFICFGMQACNKEFEDIKSTPATNNGQTAGDLIESDASFSILKAAVNKAGLMGVLKTSGNKLTVFAPDDAALTASGITAASVNAMTAAQVASILQPLLSYHIIPNNLTAAQIPTTFPNVQMPTLLPLPVGNPLVKMSIFPARRGNALYANNIPVTQADINVANGVVHKVARAVAPPSQMVAQILAADPQLSYFRAAIARADEGQTGLNRLDSVTKFGLANITVFAPTNNAFIPLLTAMLPAGTPISEAIFAALPIETVRGLVAYHMLGVRAFSVNMPTDGSFIPTLLNGAVPSHPGIKVTATFTGPVVTDFKVTGVANGGLNATVTSQDLNAVNGVVHKINMVLRPQ